MALLERPIFRSSFLNLGIFFSHLLWFYYYYFFCHCNELCNDPCILAVRQWFGAELDLLAQLVHELFPAHIPQEFGKKNPKQPINFCNTASWGQSSRNSPPLFLKFPILIAAASYKTINKQHFGKGWHLPGRFFFACATLKNFLPIIFLHCRFKSCRKTRCGGEKHELREFWGRERAWTSTFGWSSCATGMIYSAGAQGNHRGLLAWCLIHPGEVFWWRLGEKKKIPF